ncbi:MAG: hypothetical protein GIX03_04970 [Candidatus Eremiobacteraeota bacterium]|nr:hypothetical protein [Candidatus Eremiobacteraeota bacterium]MBC5802348.1 hypothetical protein [Candidatus Eremiobacteraeota bacterium]MBC5822730.1 hypothetical protein [Candidatus Eremiobacteraeota bacterium]
MRFVGILAFVFLLLARAASAQPTESESPSPSPLPAPTLPPAGIIPANIILDVTGYPATGMDVLNEQIIAALDRAIRPTLRPGAAIRYGPFVPWPLLPLALGARGAVNVTVTIDGDDVTNADVNGVTTVTVNNIVVPPAVPSVLFLSDDPEYLQTEGLVFRGNVAADRAARLYYYQSDIGVPRDLDVVLTSAVPSRVQLIDAAAGPELDVMDVGHTVSRDFLRFEHNNEGALVDVAPGHPFIVRHALIIGGEVVAGAVDLHVLSGAVGVSVVASPAGGRPDAYLNGPRVPLDGHGRHGVFALDGFGNIAQSYTVGGTGAAVKYGGRTVTPRNLDPGDLGRDFGDYGVVHRIAFTLVNPTDTPRLVYLYEKPLAGPVRSSFYIDGQLKDLGCVRMPQPYWITTYQLAPHSTGVSTTVTMPDGGSFYPLEFGVSETQPLPYTPLVGTADGCSPNVTRLAQ